jgi:hypothetical protein
LSNFFVVLTNFQSWFQFKDGRWYATEKFDTHSKCLTYDFKVDGDGDKYVEQNSVLTGLKRFSVDNKAIYKGRLASPYISEPANMIVKFPLSKSFVINCTI